MRDEYGRITPDFEAWKKLGYHLYRSYGQTYTLVKPVNHHVYDLIRAECYPEYIEKGIPNYSKSEVVSIHIKSIPFTPAELEQIKKDIDNFKKEMKNNNR